jgi:hypothetical protein
MVGFCDTLPQITMHNNSPTNFSGSRSIPLQFAWTIRVVIVDSLGSFNYNFFDEVAEVFFEQFIAFGVA